MAGLDDIKELVEDWFSDSATRLICKTLTYNQAQRIVARAQTDSATRERWERLAATLSPETIGLLIHFPLSAQQIAPIYARRFKWQQADGREIHGLPETLQALKEQRGYVRIMMLNDESRGAMCFFTVGLRHLVGLIDVVD